MHGIQDTGHNRYQSVRVRKEEHGSLHTEGLHHFVLAKMSYIAV